MNLKRLVFAAFVAVAFLARSAKAGDATAYDLAKKGDQYVGIQSKGKIVQIRSEKSIASMTPNIWYVVYYDADATFKAVQVKFEAGQETEVTHPWRIIEQVTSDKEVLDSRRLKVDSDRALKIAMAQPVLANLTLKASQLTLEHGDLGPEWRVKLWAAKLKNPTDTAEIGNVIISSEDGAVLDANLHPNNVD